MPGQIGNFLEPLVLRRTFYNNRHAFLLPRIRAAERFGNDYADKRDRGIYYQTFFQIILKCSNNYQTGEAAFTLRKTMNDTKEKTKDTNELVIREVEKVACGLLAGRSIENPVFALYVKLVIGDPDFQTDIVEFFENLHDHAESYTEKLVAADRDGPYFLINQITRGHGDYADREEFYQMAVKNSYAPKLSDSYTENIDWVWEWIDTYGYNKKLDIKKVGTFLDRDIDEAALRLAQDVANYRRDGRPSDSSKTERIDPVYDVGYISSSLAGDILRYVKKVAAAEAKQNIVRGSLSPETEDGYHYGKHIKQEKLRRNL